MTNRQDVLPLVLDRRTAEGIAKIVVGCLTCGAIHRRRAVTRSNETVIYSAPTFDAEDGHAYRPRYRGMEPEDLEVIIIEGL